MICRRTLKPCTRPAPSPTASRPPQSSAGVCNGASDMSACQAVPCGRLQHPGAPGAMFKATDDGAAPPCPPLTLGGRWAAFGRLWLGVWRACAKGLQRVLKGRGGGDGLVHRRGAAGQTRVFQWKYIYKQIANKANACNIKSTLNPLSFSPHFFNRYAKAKKSNEIKTKKNVYMQKFPL